MKSQVLKSVILGVAILATAAPAFAVATLDFTGATAGITAELAPAVTAAMPIMGIVLACTIGVKLYKRFVK